MKREGGGWGEATDEPDPRPTRFVAVVAYPTGLCTIALGMSRILSVILFFIPVFNVLSARADEVDDLVKAQMDRQHIPGLALAIVSEGKLMRAHGYGWANLELKVAVTTETVFEIGSITKQFTAVAVLMLLGGGKLGLDDNISPHLDGVPGTWNHFPP